MRQRIIDGVFRPAETLKEQSLASEFGVSRNTIRKALLKLASENLVLIEENKSARVRRFSLGEALHYLEIRALLEGLVIRQSVPFLGPSEIAEMRAILAGMKESLRAHELLQFSQRNRFFHDVVYRVCPNHPAVEMIMEIRNLMQQCNIRTMLIPGRGEDSFREHGAILSALEKRNAREAEELMLRHMAGLRETVKNHFELLL